MNSDGKETGVHPLNALTEQAAPGDEKRVQGGQRALRTLEGDIAEAVAERNASMASMAMAEEERAAKSNQAAAKSRSNAGKKFAIILASIVLIGLGGGGGYYLYLQSPLASKPAAAPKQSALPSIVAADSQKPIDVTGLGQKAILSAIENALNGTGGASGSISQVIPFKKDTSGALAVGAPDFFLDSGIGIPDILMRSLNPAWMLGTYDDSGTSQPFIILTNNFFQNAYAGMIAWEKTMPDDLAGFILRENDQQSGTSSIASYFSISGTWHDAVIKNKDVRIFEAPDGTVLLLYSFVDNGTVVITSDENALAEIIQRLEHQTFTR